MEELYSCRSKWAYRRDCGCLKAGDSQSMLVVIMEWISQWFHGRPQYWWKSTLHVAKEAGREDASDMIEDDIVEKHIETSLPTMKWKIWREDMQIPCHFTERTWASAKFSTHDSALAGCFFQPVFCSYQRVYRASNGGAHNVSFISKKVEQKNQQIKNGQSNQWKKR